MLEVGKGLLGIHCAARHRSVDCRKAQPPGPLRRSAPVPLRLASLALAALALLPGGAAAATWSAPKAITSSGTAYGPAVAIGAPDVLGHRLRALASMARSASSTGAATASSFSADRDRRPRRRATSRPR